MSNYKPLKTFTNTEILDIAIPARKAGVRWLKIDKQEKQTETMKKHGSFRHNLNIVTPAGDVRFIRETDPVKTSSNCSKNSEKADDEKAEKKEKKSESKIVNFTIQTRFVIQNPADPEADNKIREFATAEVRERFPNLPADQVEAKIADRVRVLTKEFEQNLVEWCIHEEIMAILNDIKIQVGLLNFVKTGETRIASNVQTLRKVNLTDPAEKELMMNGGAVNGMIPLDRPIVRYTISGDIEKNELWCDVLDLNKMAGGKVQKATVEGKPVGIDNLTNYLTYGSIFYQRVAYQISQSLKALECKAFVKKIYVRRAAPLKGDGAARVNAEAAKNAMDYDEDFEDYVEPTVPATAPAPVLPGGADTQADAFRDC